MASFPLHEGQRAENAGGLTTSSNGTGVVANATANTKGSAWTNLIASTAFDASLMLVMFDSIVATVDSLVDISIGAGGSEVVLLANLAASGGTGTMGYGVYYLFPVSIPAGSRLSAKSQSSTGSSVTRVHIELFSRGFLPGQPLSLVSTLGANTADSGGVSVDPGATINTEGTTWSQITASTSYPIRYLSIFFGNQLNVTRSTATWLVDIAIGAGGSEVVIIPNLGINCSTSPDVICPQCYTMLPVNIPAGTRIAVRAQCSINDATDRLFDVIMYGVS